MAQRPEHARPTALCRSILVLPRRLRLLQVVVVLPPRPLRGGGQLHQLRLPLHPKPRLEVLEKDGQLLLGATPDELTGYDFAAGSMGPKVEAACTFVRETGKLAAIGALADIEAIVKGEAGTIVEP